MTESAPVIIRIPALKQMLAWSLLCLGIIQSKTEEFEIEVRKDGVVVRTGKR